MIASRAAGRASPRLFRVRLEPLTELCPCRYVFAALTPGPDDPYTFDSSAASACYSQLSPPIPIVGSLASISWVAPPSPSDVVCVADGASAITPAPLAAAIYANGSAVPGTSNDATFVLLSAIDGSFASYPAHLGVTARVLQPSVPTGILGVPLIRSPLDVASSPLLNTNSDKYIMGSLNPWVSLPAASLSVFLKGQGPLTLQAWGAAGPPGSLPPLIQRVGFPGTFSYVAFSQGVSSLPWTPVTCTDPVNLLLGIDMRMIPGITCPAPVSIFAPNGGGYPVASVYDSHPCPPNNCGGLLRVRHHRRAPL